MPRGKNRETCSASEHLDAANKQPRFFVRVKEKTSEAEKEAGKGAKGNEGFKVWHENSALWKVDRSSNGKGKGR